MADNPLHKGVHTLKILRWGLSAPGLKRFRVLPITLKIERPSHPTQRLILRLGGKISTCIGKRRRQEYLIGGHETQRGSGYLFNSYFSHPRYFHPSSCIFRSSSHFEPRQCCEDYRRESRDTLCKTSEQSLVNMSKRN